MRNFLLCLAVLLAFTLGISQAGYLTLDLKNKVEKVAPHEKLKVIVRMNRETDISAFPQDQREAMVKHLKAFAEESQRALLSSLPGYGDKVSKVKPFWIYNGIAMEATREVVLDLVKRSDVGYIEEDKVVQIDPLQGESGPGINTIEWNLIKIGMLDEWTQWGYDGTGIKVGNIDTGVLVTHVTFGGRYLNQWFDGVNGRTSPYDDHGHGTATMGVICGGSTSDWIGVAPAALFSCAKGFDANGNGSYSSIDACFQWIADLGFAAPNVVNNSWGSPSNDTHYWQESRNLQVMGIHQVFSIGNWGPDPNTVGVPGSYPHLIGVGATDNADNIWSSSSRGPSPFFGSPPETAANYLDPYWAASRRKPDLSAPGADIRSSWRDGGYVRLYGTSLAAPHVAGTIALLLQKYHQNLTDKQIWKLLSNSCDNPSQGGPYPNQNYGWGRLNAYRALGDPPSEPLNFIAVPGIALFPANATCSWDPPLVIGRPPYISSPWYELNFEIERTRPNRGEGWGVVGTSLWRAYPTMWQDIGGAIPPVGYRCWSRNGAGRSLSHSYECWLYGPPPPGDPLIAYSSDSLATGFPNGQKIVLDRKDHLHVVFTSGDTVYYTSSNKKAKKWSTPKAVGLGKFPAIAMDSHDNPNVLWTSGTQVLSSQLSNGVWTTPYSLFSSSGATIEAPSFVINTANDSGFASWTVVTTTSSEVSLASFMPGDTTAPVSIQRVDSGGTTSFASPSLALDPTGKVLVSWSRDGEVYFQERGGPILNLSQSPGHLSVHPVVDAYGDRVNVTWQERDSTERFRIRQTVKEDGVWLETGTVSPFIGTALNPAVTGASQVTYSSDMDSIRHVYYCGIYEDGGVRCSNIFSSSSGGIGHNYPSIVMDNDWPNATLHCVWTATQSSPLSVIIKAVKTTNILVPPVPAVFVDAGKLVSSSHTIQRAGTVSYGTLPYLTADTHPQKLIYRFSGLNPNKRYRLGVTYYFEKPGETWRMRLKVDGRDGMRTRIPSGERVDDSNWVPASVYQDGVIDVEITQLEGDFALCNELALYEFTRGSGGPQEEAGWLDKPLPLTYALGQSYPNPFKDKATISYQLPEETPVSLKVFNVTGQVVRELASGKQKAGFYNAVWDGKDGSGRSVSSGVYFYRLDAGGFSKTNKLVVVR